MPLVYSKPQHTITVKNMDASVDIDYSLVQFVISPLFYPLRFIKLQLHVSSWGISQLHFLKRDTYETRVSLFQADNLGGGDHMLSLVNSAEGGLLQIDYALSFTDNATVTTDTSGVPSSMALSSTSSSGSSDTPPQSSLKAGCCNRSGFSCLHFSSGRHLDCGRIEDVVEHGVKDESFNSSSSNDGPQASWFSRMHSTLSLTKESNPDLRWVVVGSEKKPYSPFARILQRADVISISRPAPAARVPSLNLTSKGSGNPDLPFLIIPSSTPNQRDSFMIPVNDRDRSSRRKIQIPPQAVIVGPSSVSRQETVKVSISDCSRSLNSPKSEKLSKLPRLSKILPPLPASKTGSRGYPSTGTRRPLPVPPYDAERFPRRVERQAAFAGIETVGDAGLRPKQRRDTNSGSPCSHQGSLEDRSGLPVGLHV
ncbi:uncharacterized protein BT62DRAFT_1054433 [Guyanagaster necrorhizus]|uniref:Uncharacterized protein n=1 Tax=Guyanagaster necrorhizus TaxID=856835 RepID=A0A9P7VYB5_9AGAR|nr:uncharacterized protein BT62DRAFT_1054433 [Guyanagaster necrorhizus MCA 3950]KAG7449443.1 hypothetical protein BT62DRAFT_1054433 [Guyanagaster necrorhizus MCA 3950]